MLIMVLLTLAVLLLVERIMSAQRQKQKAREVDAVLSLASADPVKKSLIALAVDRRTLLSRYSFDLKEPESVMIVNNDVIVV